MRNRLLLTVVGLYVVGCTSSATRPVSAPSGGPAMRPVVSCGTGRIACHPQPPAQIDADEFRKELEHAYTHILSRADNKPPIDAAVVDIEAAASIPIPEHRTIDSAVRLFSVEMKDSIQTSLIRSARYKTMIEKALAEEQLPKGLAYLPVIESAYVNTLTSRAGAHGIWQFMPDTAREYGLRVDWWIDERADPERSTRAAAAYLRDLHRMFDDWALALAAYNCGPGRVRRTLDEAGAATFWELLEQGLLPRETRGYVPTFYAALLIARDPETHGFTLSEAGRPAHLDMARVELRGPLSLTYVAEAIGVDHDLLREMNPALRRGVVPPGGTSLRVPSDAAGTLAARADRLREEDAYVKYCSFTLRKGDSVRKLALAVGTTPETILAMNDLRSESRIHSGDSIYLPVRARELATLLAHSKDRELFYAVRKGDTLYSIAMRNGLTVAELRELNELSSGAKLRVGQNLRIAQPRTLSAGGM